MSASSAGSVQAQSMHAWLAQCNPVAMLILHRHTGAATTNLARTHCKTSTVVVASLLVVCLRELSQPVRVVTVSLLLT